MTVFALQFLSVDLRKCDTISIVEIKFRRNGKLLWEGYYMIICKKRIPRHRKGYTLAELLIVVAIIGILVAISVPIFTSQLRKAKVGVDQANARAAKGAMVTYILTDELDSLAVGDTITLYYDAATGLVSTSSDSIAPYGETSNATANDNIEGVTTTGSEGLDLTTLIVGGTFKYDGTEIVNDDGSVTLSTLIGDQISLFWSTPGAGNSSSTTSDQLSNSEKFSDDTYTGVIY